MSLPKNGIRKLFAIHVGLRYVALALVGQAEKLFRSIYFSSILPHNRFRYHFIAAGPAMFRRKWTE